MSRKLIVLTFGMAAILGIVAWVQSLALQRQHRETRQRLQGDFESMRLVPGDLAFQRPKDWLSAELDSDDLYGMRGRSGQSLLALAAYKGWPRAVTMCLDKGLDPNERDHGDATPLMWVGVGGTADTARLLIAAGANVNAADRGGVTVLMMAAQYGRADVIHELLKHGAEVDKCDSVGRTALMYAADGFDNGSRAVKTAQLLLEAGANPKTQDAKGFSAVTWAHMKPNKRLEGVLQTWKPAK